MAHLPYVRATIEHGSMRQAALALGVQQSTVSRHVVAFEQRLNIQLFERNSNGVQLTSEGMHGLKTLQELFDNLEEVVIGISRRERNHNKLRIGLCAPIGMEFLLCLIDRFKESFPDVDVVFRDGLYEKHASSIRHRRLDILFTIGRAEIRSCCSKPVWREGLCVLLPSNHNLAAQYEISREELAGENLLVPLGPDGPQFDAHFLDYFIRGPNQPMITYCHANQSTVMIKVRLGKGIALAGESLAKAVSLEGTVWRPIVGERSMCEMQAVWLESNPKTAVLRLVGMAQSMSTGGKD